MRDEIAHKGYKVGDLLGYCTYPDGRVASIWEETQNNPWVDTFRVAEEDVGGRYAIMRRHAPECNIVLDSECNVISPCTCTK
jgi:hypothetical protein